MRGVTIDLARGSDTSIDPRVAPNGTVARSENVRLDKLGRLVTRSGYTSLGTALQMGGSGALVPFDLHNVDGTLVALGNESAANQTGIRHAYRYMGSASPQGPWRRELSGNDTTLLDTSAASWDLPAADNIRIILSEVNATGAGSGGTFDPDSNHADVAITADGAFVCMTSVYFGNGQSARVSVVDTATGLVVFGQDIPSFEFNPRVLAIGQVFYVFSQITNSINVRRIDMSAAVPAFVGTVNITAASSVAPGPYDVAPYEGTTDYLIVFATAAGYAVQRRTSANAFVAGTTVAGTANAPVSVCGLSPGAVSVVTPRNPNGTEYRTFNPTTFALVSGPVNVDTSGIVMLWVSVQTLNATQVYVRALGTPTSSLQRALPAVVTVATAASFVPLEHRNVRPVTKPIVVGGRPFVWETLGRAEPAPYGLSSCAIASSNEREHRLAGVALDGLAKVSYSASTAHQISSIVKGTGTQYYVALIAKSPRGDSYRAQLIGFELFSGKRRQGVGGGGKLYLAGGNAAQYDLRLAAELGFETTPLIFSIGVTAGGAMTPGPYTYQIVFRAVSANGEVTQSAPSPPKSLTVPGGFFATTLSVQMPYALWVHGVGGRQATDVFIDVYRTESGGSIPRYALSITYSGDTHFGNSFNFVDGTADSVVQANPPLYTQGADGSVSGRLPLGIASPCRLIAESDGKLLLAGLERDTQLQISIERRPGEAPGFVNDDLFFIENPESVTAIAAGEDGRRFIFGRSNIRELVGQGPNAAGVGDISEPVEIDSRVGAVDWRSVVKTELGVMFQGSASSSRPSLYLLPRGGSAAIDIGKGIEDVLKLFPVVTSATRHDEEQLVTFTLQNTAGDDGRIVHLDLRNAGMGKSGWQGRWFVDRVAAFEAEQAPYIVEERGERIDGMTGGQTLSIDIPRGRKLGDRVVIAIHAQGVNYTQPTGYTLCVNATSPSNTVARVYERILGTGAAVLADTAPILMVAFVDFVGTVEYRVWLIRGGHASQALEFSANTTYATTTTPTSALLTPSWGAAKNLWLTACFGDGGLTSPLVPTGLTTFTMSQLRAPPAGYKAAEIIATRPGSGSLSAELGTASLQLSAASQLIAWATQSSSSLAVVLAVRPLVSSGTPIRASVQHDGRLVVCNSTDVLFSDPSAISDQGGVQIEPYIELADIYPMGIGGAGRHLGITFVGELLEDCVLTAWCSYDNGKNWTGLRSFRLSRSNGYQSGTTVRLNWTPKRRKIEGVRVRFVVTREDALTNPTGPLTQGLAFNQAVLWFEDLAGPSRVDYKRTQ